MTKRPVWLLCAVLAVVLVTYLNHFQNGFHFDDSHTVVDNPAIRSLGNVPRFFTDTTTFSVLPANRTWRPLVSTSLAFDYALGGGYVPVWFHVSTFLIFLLQLILMAALFTVILKRASPETEGANRLCALGAAAWYGLHPAIAETVNYVIQRGDIFAACGVVASMTIYALYPERRRTQVYLIPFVLALLSKPPALVFPLLLFLYVLFFETPNRAKPAAVQALPSLVVCAGMLWLQAAFTPKSYAPSILSASAYRLTQPYVLLRYFGALFLPIHLNADTDLGTLSPSDPRMLWGLVFLVLLLAAAFVCARKKRLQPVSFGLFWFVICQLPTSLFVLSEVENDHRMYLAFVGLVLAVSWSFVLAVRALWPVRTQAMNRGLAMVTLLVLALYARGTYARNRVWRTEETLWKDDVEKSPHNGRGLMNYGLTLMSRGAYPEALDLFTRALEYTPNYATLEINLGVVNDAMGRAAEAQRHFLRAISLTPRADEPYFYYGRSLLNAHRYAEAKVQLATAVALNPSRLEPHALLAAAEKQLEKAPAASAPKTAGDWLEVSLAQYQQGKFDDCIRSSRLALELDPGLAEAWNNLAASHAELRQWDPAIDAAKRALALKPELQLAKNNLAWAESGKRAGH